MEKGGWRSVAEKLDKTISIALPKGRLGEKTYAMWQFEKGEETIKFFLYKYSAEEMARQYEKLYEEIT